MMGTLNEKTKETKSHLGRPLNILLVDDDDICLFINRRVLEISGLCAPAQCASNGISALEKLSTAAGGSIPVPDIIFLDLDMPLMNGISFLEKFHGLEYPNKERIAIVLLTSSLLETDKQYAMSLGVSSHLAKPFTVEAFHGVVHTLYKDNPPAPFINSTFIHHDPKPFSRI